MRRVRQLRELAYFAYDELASREIAVGGRIPAAEHDAPETRKVDVDRDACVCGQSCVDGWSPGRVGSRDFKPCATTNAFAGDDRECLSVGSTPANGSVNTEVGVGGRWIDQQIQVYGLLDEDAL